MPCGAANLYCPAGSAAPSFVDAGFYSYSSAVSGLPATTAGLSAFSNNTYASSSRRAGVAEGYRPDDGRGAMFRSGIAVCPAGWFCTGDGSGSECPPGSYGSEVSKPRGGVTRADGPYCGGGIFLTKQAETAV